MRALCLERMLLRSYVCALSSRWLYPNMHRLVAIALAHYTIAMMPGEEHFDWTNESRAIIRRFEIVFPVRFFTECYSKPFPE